MKFEDIIDKLELSDNRFKELKNIEGLVKYLAQSAYNFSGELFQDNKSVNDYIDSLTVVIKNFYNILDYDNDGVVELVDEVNGEKVLGEDVELLKKDIGDIYNVLSGKGKNTGANIFNMVAIMSLYFSSERFTTTRDDFIEFKNSCVKAIELYKKIDKKINLENALKFIIYLCVITVPLINLLNKSDANITKESINHEIRETYGDHYEFIIKSSDDLAKAIVKSIQINKCWRRIFCCKK